MTDVLENNLLDPELSLERFNFDLPPDHIAQQPVEPRDNAKLLVFRRDTGELTHHRVFELPELLNPGDLLIRNNSKVIPARLHTTGKGGGKIEILLAEPLSEPGNDSYKTALNGYGISKWRILAKPSRRFRIGDTFQLAGGAELTVDAIRNRGERFVTIKLHERIRFLDWLTQFGEIPLPPYIDRTATEADRMRYQTVFADPAGSVAAPTAGLHFTPELETRLHQRGIEFADLTLHVGLGTFQPVRAESIDQHRILPEWVEVPETVIQQIRAARARNGRIIAVGTTSTRSLEQWGKSPDSNQYQGWCDLYLRPGHHFQVVQGLMTNFHLPKSSLFILISAFLGREVALKIYQEAIQQNYRFYSYGDACLFL